MTSSSSTKAPQNEEAEKYKEQANECVKELKYEDAIKNYNKAIALNPSNPVYFSNRSAAFAGLKKFEAALTDAQKCLDLDKSFVKGYSRKGFALYKLGRISEAENCYTEGLVVDPENIALKEAAAAIRRTRELKEKAESKKGLLGKMGGWVSKLANGDHGSRLMMYGILFLGYWWFYRSGAKTAEAEKAKAAEATSNVFSLQLEPGKIVRGVRNFGRRSDSSAAANAASTTQQEGGHAVLTDDPVQNDEDEDAGASNDSGKPKSLDTNAATAPTSFVFVHAWGLSSAEFTSSSVTSGGSSSSSTTGSTSLFKTLRKETDANFLALDLPCHGWSTCWANTFQMADYEAIAKKLVEKEKDFLGERRVLVGG